MKLYTEYNELYENVFLSGIWYWFRQSVNVKPHISKGNSVGSIEKIILHRNHKKQEHNVNRANKWMNYYNKS